VRDGYHLIKRVRKCNSRQHFAPCIQKAHNSSSKKYSLFCGEEAKYEKNKRGNAVFPVRTRDFQSCISKTCEEKNDDWGKIVANRLAHVIDLLAADVI